MAYMHIDRYPSRFINRLSLVEASACGSNGTGENIQKRRFFSIILILVSHRECCIGMSWIMNRAVVF